MIGLSLRGVGHKLGMVATATILSMASAGCYSLVPSQTSNVIPGREIGLEINDLGRINLTPSIGGDVSMLAGTLVQHTDSAYTLKVSELTFLNGKTSQWSGEPVVVKDSFVRTLFERKFSSGRTAAAVIASAGVVTGLVLGRNLNGSGDAAGGDPKQPGGGTSDRVHH